MPIQHPPHARQTRSQDRAQAVLAPTPRAPLDSTPAVPQLRAQFGRSRTIQEGRKRAKRIKFLFRSSWKFSRTFKDHFQRSCTGGPTLAQSNHPEPSLLAMMQQNDSDYGQSSEASRKPAFNTSSMKAPECFYGTQPFKVTSFIQYCQLIFYNDLENFSQDRKKVLHATSSLIGRAAKWIEPYLSNITNQDPSYILHS
ncbi:hypothetical protein O181_012811 [Austropuccinia psidii MF-1]|uniref:DUF4939 domain-containing protein n=1 Tax=Austropuccinia psidii MF-1 TaxID=1389203 RepID=A0A9Q3GMN1_9BASI|nr:hypothetical protein [Austropuccinia psidii MF-1]